MVTVSTRCITSLLLSMFVFTACSRTDTSTNLSVTVIEQITRELADGNFDVVTKPVPNALVYLRPSGKESISVQTVNNWPGKKTDRTGRAIFSEVEGIFDVFSDIDGDGILDIQKLAVSSSQSKITLISEKNEPLKKVGDSDKTKVEPKPATLPPSIAGIWINGGASETSSYDVAVTITSANAVYVSFTETPPSVSPRIPYINALGYRLSYGQGRKTLWANVYGSDNSFAGPVSTSITVKTNPPYPPFSDKLTVYTNPPGSADFLEGTAGAVESSNRVRVYSDRDLVNLVSETVSNADGSISTFSIGDGSSISETYVDEQDYIYVTAVDIFDRESVPVWIENDSTPPIFFADQLNGGWIIDNAAPNIGNHGDVLRIGFSPNIYANDVVGGQISFPALLSTALNISGQGYFGTDISVPASLSLDASGRVSGRVWDAAMNRTDWISPEELIFINTAPPGAVTVPAYLGDNRRFRIRWKDTNWDTESYLVIARDESGTVVYSKVISVREYQCYINSGGDCFPNYSPKNQYFWDVGPLLNCHVYTVEVQVKDAGWNLSTFSMPVTDRVIIPPPFLRAWGGVSDPGSGFGAIFYTMTSVQYASDYEMNFSESSQFPNFYTATSGFQSPLLFAEYPVTSGTLELSQMSSGKRMFISARTYDDTCESDYSIPISAMTDLRLVGYTDGVTSYQTFGGALTYTVDSSDIKLLVGAPRIQSVAVLDATTTTYLGTFGHFHVPEDFDLPGTPLASVNLDGDSDLEMIVGSPIDTINGLFLSGSVSIYDTTTSTLATLAGPTQGLQFGHSVANASDLNGDGLSEFLVGSLGCLHRDCLWPAGSSLPAPEGPGIVVLYDGASLLPIATHVGAKGEIFGTALSAGFDYDGDLVNDYVIGAPGAAGHSNISMVYIFSGSSHEQIAAIKGIPFSMGGNRFGTAVAGISDFSGDGRPDLVIGAPSDSDSGVGAVLFLASSEDPASWSLAWSLSGNQFFAGPKFGSTLVASSDLDGDGMPDVLIGSPGSIQNYYYGAGTVFAASTRSRTVSYEIRGKSLDGGLGYSLLLPPDLNGKPRPEWVIGAPGSAFAGYQSGRVYIFTTDIEE